MPDAPHSSESDAMQDFLISKYSDSERSGADESWTSYSQIGQSLNGSILTATEYYEVEDSCLQAVRKMTELVGASCCTIRWLYLGEEPPLWAAALYEGCSIDVELALKYLRYILRFGMSSCVFEFSSSLIVSVEFDYYLSTTSEALVVDEALRGSALRSWDADFEAPAWKSPAVFQGSEDLLWDVVASRRTQGETLILEKWAGGRYGRRWYLVGEGALAEICNSVRPGSALFPFFDVDIQWIPGSNVEEFADSDVWEGRCLVAFSRPVSGSLLKSVDVSSVDDVMEGGSPIWGEVGMFSYLESEMR